MGGNAAPHRLVQTSRMSYPKIGHRVFAGPTQVVISRGDHQADNRERPLPDARALPANHAASPKLTPPANLRLWPNMRPGGDGCTTMTPIARNPKR